MLLVLTVGRHTHASFAFLSGHALKSKRLATLRYSMDCSKSCVSPVCPATRRRCLTTTESQLHINNKLMTGSGINNDLAQKAGVIDRRINLAALSKNRLSYLVSGQHLKISSCFCV